MADLDEQSDSGVIADAADTADESSEKAAGRLERLFAFGRWKRWLAVVGGLGLLVTVGVLWYGSRETLPPPDEQLQMALELLDQRDDVAAQQEAGVIAARLLHDRYRDVTFAGGPEFILGILAFRQAESVETLNQNELYTQVVELQIEAEHQLLIAERRPEWNYSLGVSLYHIGRVTEARPHLEKALQTETSTSRWPAVASKLIDIYLDVKTPRLLAKALELSRQLIGDKRLSPDQRDRAYLQRAQVLLALDRTPEAEQIIAEKLSLKARQTPGTRVFHARMLMATARREMAAGRTPVAKKTYDRAVAILRDVSDHPGLENRFPRQASYLIGVSLREQGDIEGAISAFLTTGKQKYEESQEGLAANVAAAELMRKKGRDEEALDAYRRSLQLVRRGQYFPNRWLKRHDFRRALEAAWKSWVQGHKFAEAIELARLMPPVLPDVQAIRFVAVANERWAESLEAELKAAPFREQQRRRHELIRHWQQSGRAFAKLAFALRTTAEYSEILRHSAENYRKGHDFDNALKQLTRFIDTDPTTGLPSALVRRGEILTDLDRLDEALDHYRHVIDMYPDDIAAFEARYLIGRCYLERNEPDKAEQAWREILTSNDLNPKAEEWRRALFSLGRLLALSADALDAQAKSPDGVDEEADRKKLFHTAARRWDEAIRRLDEYLNRYPQTQEAIAARFLLAQSLQHAAEIPRRKLKEAETENAQMELRNAMGKRLSRAVMEYRTLQQELIRMDETGRLNTLRTEMLRDCYFDISRTYYTRGEWDKAILTYTSAVNRYPQDPRVVLAYIHMTYCNDALGKPAEARSMLQQARVILNTMPEGSFDSRHTNSSKADWQRWLQWAQRLHRASETQRLAGP